MNVYPNERLVVLCLIAVFVLLAVTVWVVWWRRSRVPWRPLPNYYPGTRWFSRVQTMDPKFIARALAAAETCIINSSNWSAANMALVGHHVHVYVMDTELWQPLYGRNVPGLHVGHMLIVGPSMSGLAHELAHLAELVLEKANEYDHGSWQTRGITQALEEYDGWLARQKQADSIASGVISLRAVQERARYGPPLAGMAACRYRRPA